MQRREIKRGARDARDRARHRGRHHRTASTDDPLEEVGQYLNAMEIPNPIHIDLDQYARDTAHIAVGLGERLRQLAIQLEDHRGVRAWSVLEPIYAAALEANPQNPHTWSSWALAYWHTNPDTSDTFEKSVGAGRRAVALDPDEGHTHGILGMLLYKAHRLDEARVILLRAIELGHSGWPHLWLAHVLHDQECWSEAADAYSRIPAQDLPPHSAWRVQLARQQRAACLLRAGLRQEALAVYSEVLSRFQRALDAELDSNSSPVLGAGAPEYLFADIESLPELAEGASELRARLEQHPDPLLQMD